MSTKLYLPASSATPPISPTPNATWNTTTGVTRIMASTAKTNTALANATTASIALSQKGMNRQFIYGPLNPVTISGTATCVIRATVPGISQEDFLVAWLRLYVVSSDGGTVRGQLLNSPTGSLGTVNTSLRNIRPQRYSGASFALNSVAASAGDYIVIEPGFSADAGASTGTYNFGDDNASDLTDNETGTSAGNPWIQFSTNMSILAGGSRSYIIF